MAQRVRETDLTFTVSSLEQAAGFAREHRGPVRVWHARSDDLAEIFFYGDFVIHASAGALMGLDAVRRMLASPQETYFARRGTWPSRHTMLLEWRSVQSETGRDAEPDDDRPALDPSEITVRL